MQSVNGPNHDNHLVMTQHGSSRKAATSHRGGESEREMAVLEEE